MNAPKFVKVVNGYWTLEKDEWIRPYIEAGGALNWEQCFAQVREALGARAGTVVDVGAFIGDSAAWFCDHPLVTFEPQRDAFACLAHNLAGHLHLPFPAGNGELAGIQFGEGGNMGARRLVREGEMVRTVRIDELELDDVVLIKIDVEGWEPNVLAGARETMARCKPLVVIEYNKAGLENCGFGFADIDRYFEKGWVGRKIYECGDSQWDTLWTPL